MDTTDLDIEFDENGRCDYCNNYYKIILPSWHPDKTDEKKLQQIVENIKKDVLAKSMIASLALVEV